MHFTLNACSGKDKSIIWAKVECVIVKEKAFIDQLYKIYTNDSSKFGQKKKEEEIN